MIKVKKASQNAAEESLAAAEQMSSRAMQAESCQEEC